MLPPIHLEPQKHVYSIVYIYVYTFKIFHMVLGLPTTAATQYLYICDHQSTLYQTTLVFKQNSNIFVDDCAKCTSVPGCVHASEQFNINFPKLSTILASCPALYIGTKHSICHITGICISCRFIKSRKIIIKSELKYTVSHKIPVISMTTEELLWFLLKCTQTHSTNLISKNTPIT